jgi:two-component system chemotaxis response regulator CheY
MREKRMSSPKVMIVDDVAFMRKTIRIILENKGFTVVGEVDDPRNALKLYQTHQPDLVILDFSMPRLNGIEVAKQIIAHDKDAKILSCTSASLEKNIRGIIEAGVKDVIVKPFDVEDLCERCTSLVQAKIQESDSEEEENAKTSPIFDFLAKKGN